MPDGAAEILDELTLWSGEPGRHRRELPEDSADELVEAISAAPPNS